MENNLYEIFAHAEMLVWRKKQLLKGSGMSGFAKNFQHKINNLIPEFVHKAFTTAIKSMTNAMLGGSEFFQKPPDSHISLQEREEKARSLIKIYAASAAAEGGATGAGGILMSFADFPALMAIKIKMLFSLAAVYGHDSTQAKERLYMLLIFQTTFSTGKEKHQNLLNIEKWNHIIHPKDALEHFDWKAFQIQYRDHIDLIKLAQMIPLAGAPVGAIANHHLVSSLGQTAIMAYRMRYLHQLNA